MTNSLFKKANHKFTLPTYEAAAKEPNHKTLMWLLCRETKMLCVEEKKTRKEKSD